MDMWYLTRIRGWPTPRPRVKFAEALHTVSTRSEYPKGNLGLTAPFLAMVTVSTFPIVHLMVVMPYNEEICLCLGL